MTQRVRPGSAPKVSRAEKVHAATPDSRNRVVDFLRAAAITVVVLGHWTLAAVYADEGGILPHGALQAPWTHPLTWVFQVMPIFFLVGGYSNGLSLRSARRKNIGYAEWLRARLRRLGTPLIPLLVGWLVACVVALAAGMAPATLETGTQMALIPTWFLAAYLLVIALAPPCLWLWERFGLRSIFVGLALAGVVDAVSIHTSSPLAGYPNYLLVWASFHQFGYAWLDGRLASRARRIAMVVVGAIGLALLVGLGPYPVSMVTVEGEAISNSNPTRITMAFLGMMQAGIVLLAEPALKRWLQRPRLWLITVLINQRIMTWFLWHLTALVALSGALLALGGPGLHFLPLSGAWWATRPLWWAVLLVVTLGFVLLFGRFENPRPDHRPAPPVWKSVAAAVCVVAGLAVMANAGIVNESGVVWIWPLLPVVGLLVLSMVQLPRRGSSPESSLPRTDPGTTVDAHEQV